MKLSEIIRYPSVTFERCYVNNEVLQDLYIDDSEYIINEFFILGEINYDKIPNRITVKIKYDFVDHSFRLFTKIGLSDEYINPMITFSLETALQTLLKIFDDYDKKTDKYYDVLQEYSWDTLQDEEYAWNYVNYPINEKNIQTKLKQMVNLEFFDVKVHKDCDALEDFVDAYNSVPDENYIVLYTKHANKS